MLLAFAFVLLRVSVPADPLEPGAWLKTSSSTVVIALNIIPFAGIAFLWFIGVLRDRLGQREDRFFATVFFGSGLLFLAMLFVASAMVGALIIVFAEQPDALVNAAAFRFARATIYSLINIYMIKMAAVFIISTSTVAVYTGFSRRWIALLGYALAALILSRQRLHDVEFRRVPDLGSAGQFKHSHRQSEARLTYGRMRFDVADISFAPGTGLIAI